MQCLIGVFVLSSCSPEGVTVPAAKKWVETKFVPSNGAAYDFFGKSVCLSPDARIFIVGAYYKNSSTGTAYDYTLSGGNWIETPFNAFDAAAGDEFGISVTVGGGIFYVGAQKDDDKGADSGAVYQRKWSGLGWTGAKLIVNNGAAGDQFGCSVSASSNGAMVAIGARNDAVNFPCEGAVYLFTQSGLNWATNKLYPSDGGAGMWFGGSVSLSIHGSAVMVGAVGQNSYTGGAYLYEKSGVSWIETKFIPHDAQTNLWFGYSVAVSGDGNTVAVGAENKTNMNYPLGALYIYKKSGTEWMTNKITLTNGGHIGYSVAVSADGNTVAAGAPADSSLFPGVTGSVYLYRWNGSGWDCTRFNASDSAANYFGNSVSLSADGNTLLVGAKNSSEYGIDSGSVYLYQWK